MFENGFFIFLEAEDMKNKKLTEKDNKQNNKDNLSDPLAKETDNNDINDLEDPLADEPDENQDEDINDIEENDGSEKLDADVDGEAPSGENEEGDNSLDGGLEDPIGDEKVDTSTEEFPKEKSKEYKDRYYLYSKYRKLDSIIDIFVERFSNSNLNVDNEEEKRKVVYVTKKTLILKNIIGEILEFKIMDLEIKDLTKIYNKCKNHLNSLIDFYKKEIKDKN